MKRLLLALTILSLLLAGTATAKQPQVLLKKNTMSFTLQKIYPYCIPFDTDFWNANYCGWQYAAWHPARNAHVTEVSVVVLRNTGEQAGHCVLQFWLDDGTDYYALEQIGEDYYINTTGTVAQIAGTGGPGFVNRQPASFDVLGGYSIGVGFNDYLPTGGNCLGESDDAILEVFIWGYYTE